MIIASVILWIRIYSLACQVGAFLKFLHFLYCVGLFLVGFRHILNFRYFYFLISFHDPEDFGSKLLAESLLAFLVMFSLLDIVTSLAGLIYKNFNRIFIETPSLVIKIFELGYVDIPSTACIGILSSIWESSNGSFFWMHWGNDI